jgi:uncharacterized membrane protein
MCGRLSTLEEDVRKKLLVAAFLVVIAVSGAAAFAAASNIKVPKCSQKLCHDVGCAADFYCASGAHVKSCAEICNGN